MSDKKKFPRAAAIAAAKVIVEALKPFCLRLIVAGSLRRRKQEVGDVEILYVPKIEFRAQQITTLFGEEKVDDVSVNLVDRALENLITAGTIAKRENVLDRETWGPKIKLAIHVASGIPVDFFSTVERSWFNYLVCRTGSAETNTRIASSAKRKGWKWCPYSPGFQRADGRLVAVTSEREVFQLSGLPYLEPHER